MKPQQPDIDWCLANPKLVMQWLEKRGGWEHGDRLWFAPGLTSVCTDDRKEHGKGAVWLPTAEDAIEMLIDRGIHPELLCTTEFRRGIVWLATNYVFMVPIPEECHETPCIALMELLKSVEGENENLSTEC